MNLQLNSMVATLKSNPRFTDRIILVTGATAGIGRALALQLGKRGAIVILLGRNESELDTVYDAIIESGGPVPAIIPCDLSTLTSEQAQELANHIQENFGKLDGLAHIAGTLGGRGANSVPSSEAMGSRDPDQPHMCVPPNTSPSTAT